MVQFNCWESKYLRTGTSALALLVAGGFLSSGAAHAQAAPPAPVATSASDSEPEKTPEDESDSQSEKSDQIVVTGTLIRGEAPVGSSLISVSAQDIAKTGSTTPADIVAKVPQLNSFGTTPVPSRYTALAPGLRGLPSNATLVLMNGHRVVGESIIDSISDFPSVPGLAIQRVEVVADGASALYGADAVTGVVNFITRKKAEGLEASFDYGAGKEYYSASASLLWGHEWSRGSLIAAYQYTKNDNILNKDRDWRVVNFLPFGGTDPRATTCPDANVKVPQTGSVNYAAPNFLANTTNRCDLAANADLFPSRDLHAFYARGEYQITDHIRAWADILYSILSVDTRVAVVGATATIKNTNPFFIAPAGTGATQETVSFSSAKLFGNSIVIDPERAKTGNASLGVDIDLPFNLHGTVFGTIGWSNSTLNQTAFQLDQTALAAAAAGTTAATALDPFGTSTNPAVAAAITNAAIYSDISHYVQVGGAKIDGSLFSLPGGDLKIAVGAEYRHESFNSPTYYGNPRVFQFAETPEHHIESVYGELFIPIFGEGNSTTLMRRLEVSLSGRYDHYSDFGSTKNPKVGVNWSPIDGLTFRGTYGTSFRAPSLTQSGGIQRVFFSPASGNQRFDPTRGANQVDTLSITFGNPNLKPETARTYSFGADLTPRGLPGFRAGITYYDVHFTNVIVNPPVGELFTNPLYASRVVRSPSAALIADVLAHAVPVGIPVPLPAIGTFLDERPGNFGIRDTDGIDFNASYRWDTSFGSMNVGVAGNHIFKFQSSGSATATPTDSLKAGIADTTLQFTGGFSYGPFDFNTFVNYRSGITNNYSTPTGTASYKADSYTTVNLRLALNLPDTGVTKGTSIALQVNDLFDQRPPFFPSGNGTGGPINVIGRYIGLNIRKTAF